MSPNDYIVFLVMEFHKTFKEKSFKKAIEATKASIKNDIATGESIIAKLNRNDETLTIALDEVNFKKSALAELE